MITFTDEPLHHIHAWLSRALFEIGPGATVECRVCDPDLGAGLYAGEPVTAGGIRCLARSVGSWAALAVSLGARLGTPVPDGEGFVRLTFRRLRDAASFHHEQGDPREKYGVGTEFFRISKTEEPAVLHYLLEAFEKTKTSTRPRVLELGAHRGDLLGLLLETLPPEAADALEFWGIDHSPSATAAARERFVDERFHFLEMDIADLPSLQADPFDLILSVGTLQSPGVDFHRTVMELVQRLLSPRGALILGLPNCRWMDGEMVYGARAPNYNYPELSLVLKDLAWCRRYLTQHRFRVTVTGREYLFLTATPLGRL